MAAAELRPPTGLVLISGPGRGGKSAWAEHLALHAGCPVVYLATGAAADPGTDPAWSARVDQHQRRRPEGWGSREVGGDLATALRQLRQEPPDGEPPLLLIDSLGTWLAWHLEDGAERWQQRCQELLEQLLLHPAPVLLVVEETGWGVVPPTAIGGLFRDRLGALQQLLMAHCSGAWLVVAGRALDLLDLSHPVPTL